MSLKLLISAAVFGWAMQAHAVDDNFEAGDLTTSSDFHSQSLKAMAEISPNWGLFFGNDAGRTQGSDFDIVKVGGHATKKYSKIEWGADVAFYSRTISNYSSAQYASGSISAKKTIGKSSNIKLEAGQGYVAEDLQTAYAIDNGLRGFTYKLSDQLYLSERWRSDFFARQIFLGDSNVRSDQDLDFMYGVSPGWPWIWVGAGIDNMANSISSSHYWSPREFYSYGPRIDIAFPITDRFSFAMGFNLNFFRDIDFGEGTGYYGLAKATYDMSKTLQFHLSCESIRSEQQDNTWTSLAGYIGVQWSH